MQLITQLLTPENLMLEAEKAFAYIEEEFVEKLGWVPRSEDVAWTCMRRKECGWWDDTVDNLRIQEMVFVKKSASGLVLPGGKPTAQLQCPKCHAKIKAIAKEVFLSNARKRGEILLVWENKHTA